ncbi:hypothetical protein L218DRAFT_1009153 [Marasmius fiardii PR-910]|nr:hypothetical protein L218DRAFT_1009153 [Marasmius fiardii PR-910]
MNLNSSHFNVEFSDEHHNGCSISLSQTDVPVQTASHSVLYGDSVSSASLSQRPHIPSLGYSIQPTCAHNLDNFQNSLVNTPIHRRANRAVQETAYFEDPASQWVLNQHHCSIPVRGTHLQASHTDSITSNYSHHSIFFPAQAQGTMNERGTSTFTPQRKEYPETTSSVFTASIPRPRVGSVAGTQIAISNRKKPPVYFCNVPGCTSKGFTSFHNFECKGFH